MSESVRSMKGIGEKTEKLLSRLGISTIDQFVHYYPRAYVTYPDPMDIEGIRPGMRCSVYACIDSPLHLRSYGRRKVISCLAADRTGSLFLRWFNMPYLKNVLSQDQSYVFTGTVRFKDGRLMMEQPEYCSMEVYRKKTETFQPVYPLTAGLSNQLMRKFLKLALEGLEEKDYLPTAVASYYDLMDENTALREVHFPTGQQSLYEARKRIIFNEFFKFFAALSLVRQREEKSLNTHIIPFDDRLKAFVDGLPFELTRAQKDTLSDIRFDLSATRAMNRLVQGDVGSGKTIVAFIAMYAAVLAGYQAVMMVPTEVLAMQHYESLLAYFSGRNVRIEVLTGSMKAAEKRRVRNLCRDGGVDLVVGTHALIQDGVSFHKLALAVTDEQHRFGVRQRDLLMKKGDHPHVLVMSATPIPRTLAIILYRDMDISLMDELPKNRLPIKNSVVGPTYRPAAWAFMKKQVAAGRQCYVICPAISGDEDADLNNVEDYTKMLAAAMPASCRVESLNGRMSADRKNEVMNAFSRGEIDILVSTTVIEVGIDVANACVMMIENADRFGLAQLHQLRGRVGRGKDQSYCIFMTESQDQGALDRLSVIGHSNSGFEIAEADLKLRGPGDFFGTKQSGTMNFALADIYANADILKMAAEAVDHLQEEAYNFRELLPEDFSQALNFANNL